MKNIAEIGTGVNPDWGIDWVNNGYAGYFVEPNPQRFAMMQVYVSRRVKSEFQKNVIGCNFAISFESNLCLLNTFPGNPDSTFLESVPVQFRCENLDSHGGAHQILVQSMGFGDFVSICKFEAIRIDIEGAESIIFDNGMELSDAPDVIIIEFHTLSGKDKVSAQLSDFGYVVEHEDRAEPHRPE